MNATSLTIKTILLRIVICLTIIAMWAWMSADEWEQELINEQVEQERVQSILAYNKRMQSSALGEDYVDTTPLPTVEPETPIYTSAKKSVVKTKKRIKNSTRPKN
jgi:hypothetical protein